MAVLTPNRRHGAGLVALTALAVAAGCTGAVVDGSFRGEPLLVLYGWPAPDGPIDQSVQPVYFRAALFWAPDLDSLSDVAALVEEPAAGVKIAGGGQRFVLPVFDAPPAERFVTTPAGARWAVARVLVYEDRNGNGRRDPGEPVDGGADRAAVVYAAEDLPAERSPTGVAMPAGYHELTVPFACLGADPYPKGDADCGVPLGAACASDDRCGQGGSCANALGQQPPHGMPAPNGYCTLLASDGGCQPAGGVLYDDGGAPKSQWLRACASDADCRTDGPYHCDLGLGACADDELHVLVRPHFAFKVDACRTR